MKFVSIINERNAVPRHNPVDELLLRLQKACLLESRGPAYDRDYWKHFSQFLSLEDLIFVLNFQQEGNWNYILYEECQHRYAEIVNNSIEEELFDEL